MGLYIDDTVPFLGQCEQFLAVDDFYALDDLRFEVGASGSGVIRFVLDVDVMEDVLTDPGNDPAGGNSCTAFKDNLLSIMRIEEDT